MFDNGFLSPSGVRIYSALAHNVAGVDVTDTDDPQVQDLIRKYQERGRQLFHETSEDSLSWSFFRACSRLPQKDWLVDFFRVAVNEKFSRAYAPYVDEAQIRFWVAHPSPQVYTQWILAKVRREGEAAFKHLDQFDARIRAKRRLEKILAGDPAELPERATEVDVEIRIGKRLVVFIECKLFADSTISGTFQKGRGQILRNIELLEDVARRENFSDRRFILLTLDRHEKLYTAAMRRYKNVDMRRLRDWDAPGNIEALRLDLPHRSAEPESVFQEMTTKLGWILWHDAWKIYAHHATAALACRP